MRDRKRKTSVNFVSFLFDRKQSLRRGGWEPRRGGEAERGGAGVLRGLRCGGWEPGIFRCESDSEAVALDPTLETIWRAGKRARLARRSPDKG